MAYSEFTTLEKVLNAFNLEVEENRDLFGNVEPVLPSDYIQQTPNYQLF